MVFTFPSLSLSLLQITELLEEEKLEACEELPRDGEDGPSSLSPKHAHVTPSSR